MDVRGLIDTVDFVELVGRKTHLTRVEGERYRGLSPFRSEKTPSFFVRGDAKTWYCFSTGQGGGVLDFIEATEGVQKQEAVKILAEYLGEEIDDGPSDYARLALKYSLEFFRSHSDKINEYVSKRGFSLDVIEDYQLGFAPKRGHLAYLQDNGISPEHAAMAGLAYIDKKSRKPVSRYSGRLMIPIFNEFGTLVSFTGRDMLPENKDFPRAKYMHGGNSHLFQRRKVVWGLPTVRREVSEQQKIVVVEGQLDAMALSEAGIPAVATLGSNMSTEQLSILSKVAQNIYLCYDSDESGQQGMIDVFEKNKELKIDSIIHAIVLPEGMDPEDYLNKFGAQDFLSKMESADSDTSMLVDVLVRKHALDGKRKSEVARDILYDLRNSITPTFVMSYRGGDLVERLSQTLGVSTYDLQTWMAQTTKNGGEVPSGTASYRGISKKLDTSSFPAPIPERRILYSILNNPEYINRLKVPSYEFQSHLVYRILQLVEPTYSMSELMEVIQSKLTPEEYDMVVRLLSIGVPNADFEFAQEVMLSKTLAKEKVSHSTGRPRADLASVVRPSAEDAIFNPPKIERSVWERKVGKPD